MLHLSRWSLAEVGVQPLKGVGASVIINLGVLPALDLPGHEGHVSVGDFILIIVLPQLLDENLPLRGLQHSVHEDGPLAPVYQALFLGLAALVEISPKLKVEM